MRRSSSGDVRELLASSLSAADRQTRGSSSLAHCRCSRSHLVEVDPGFGTSGVVGAGAVSFGRLDERDYEDRDGKIDAALKAKIRLGKRCESQGVCGPGQRYECSEPDLRLEEGNFRRRAGFDPGCGANC